jgi:ketosteroid isomerase-like protein
MTCILLIAGMLLQGAAGVADNAAVSPETPEGKTAMEVRSERIRNAFNGLNKDTIDSLDGFYAPDVAFVDPLGTIQGLAALKAYYTNMYKTVTSVRFEFTDEVAQGDTHVMMWTMHLEAKGLNKGRPVQATGNSVIRFGPDDTVVYHRDYFDMGEFVYQHIPLLRFLVRKVNGALAHKE